MAEGLRDPTGDTMQNMNMGKTTQGEAQGSAGSGADTNATNRKRNMQGQIEAPQLHVPAPS